MLRNYIKTALRSLFRETSNTVINISGLSLGIACSLILFLIVTELTSFDKFHSKRNRIYRIVNQSDGNSGKNYTPGVPSVLPDAFRTDFPEAEEVVFTQYRAGALISIPQSNGDLPKKYSEEKGVAFTEPGFFKIFDRGMIEGDALKGLDEPNEALISKSWAKKYFGKEDAIGEILKFEDKEYKISGIMEDSPSNTDLPFDLMLSYVTIKKRQEENGWHSTWSDEQCYFLLKEGEDAAKVEKRIPDFSNKYLGEDNTRHSEFMFQPLSEIHFDTRFGNYSYHTVPKTMLIALGVIGFVLIISACINFINLSTAEAIKRSKEVGVRKSLGSTRGQLVRQFLGETTLVTILALVIALAFTQLVLGFLNPFLELDLSLDFLHNTTLWIYIISVTVIVSGLSGLYPAFVISGFKPALALKNQITNRNSSGYMLRRSLVVLQFFISQLFMIGTVVIISQMNYFNTKDLGFAKDAIIIAPVFYEETNAKEANGISKMRTLRDEMARVNGVEMTSLSSTPPTSGNVSSTHFTVDGATDDHGAQVKQIDGHYLDLYKVELAAGENIADLDTATGFLVNEKLAHIAGFPNAKDIIGKHLNLWDRKLPIVGVVKDFHTVSLSKPIEATAMLNSIEGYETLALKINMSKSQDVIKELKTKWEAAYPDQLFSYEFLDDNIRESYEGIEKMSILISIFTTLAIFIGCLGLFGLASFMINQKTKEIGVRKVLGASVESIVFIFSKEYLKLIVIGFVLAAPVAWFFMNMFLEQFAYKIEIGPSMFLISLGSALVIALLTVSYKSIKAAIRNPVKSLRYE
jgi:putative ABC transport system permease protein